nr:hypothetical protein [Micromonospora sp. DSM 115978]
MTFRLGVISPPSTVKSSGRIENFLIDSAFDTVWFAVSMDAWMDERRSGSSRRSATLASAGFPFDAFH